jgi:hypothetical protein
MFLGRSGTIGDAAYPFSYKLVTEASITRQMNDEIPTDESTECARVARGSDARRWRQLPEPLEAVVFAVQERVIWPLQDRFSLLPGPSPALIGGGAAALVAVVVAIALLSSGGGGSAPTTAVSEASAPSEPLMAPAHPAAAKPKPKKAAPRGTLHGAAPVFSPPSPASKGGEKTGKSEAAEKDAASSEGSGSESGNTDSQSGNASSPASATISSDPKKTLGADEEATASSAARAAVPSGPPAGPAAVKVAREFARGFVVYETGGEAAEFRDAFKATAAPRLTKALLERPPKQPAGVKVPRAKVLNVVAGPSQGEVYAVSVSLLRVGVTSELRLQMEKVDSGKSGKRAEWRVTNVLG